MMRTIKIGEQEIGLKASPLALIFYKQAFGTDLVGDLVKMRDIAEDPSNLDSVFLLQLTWAMAKTHEGVGNKFPDFMTWVADLESFDFTDEDVLNAIVDEAMDGFFPRGSRTKSK
jgi:hypothetical protein